jgi:hypothetical protein
VLAQPSKRVVAGALGSAGEIDDLMGRRRFAGEAHADVQRRILRRGREKGVPVLRFAGDETQPMPDVGDHAVDVEDDASLRRFVASHR